MPRLLHPWVLGALLALSGVVMLGGAQAASRFGRAGAPPGATRCAGAWQRKADYPVQVTGVGAVGVGGYIYTFGGDNPSGAYRYDPAGDSWTPRAGPPSIGPRPGVVTDGVDIYILTGFSGAPPASTLYRYDPASDSYTALESPPHATGEHGLVYLDGKIYRISGHDSLNPTPTVDVYTIASGTWAPAGTVADYPQAVYEPVAVSAGGYIYAGGGGGVGYTMPTQTYRYDPAANRWDDAPVPDLPFGRTDVASVLLNGRWVISGGLGPAFQRLDDTVALDLSDLQSGWTALPWPPVWRMGAAGAALDSTFYTVAGFIHDLPWAASTVAYSESPCGSPTPAPSPTPTAPPPACGTAVWQQAAPYPIPAAMSGAVSLGGQIYTFGGYSRGTPVADAFRYDPQTNGWSAIAPLPRALLGVGAVTDGRYIYLVNGSDVYQRALATLYRYDPQNDSYAALASPRQPTFRHALAILNSKIYRIGGDTGQGATAGVEVFDIATASWGTVAPQPVARMESAAVAYNGYIYTVGGDVAGEKTYRYDPVADEWDDAAIADLPAAPIGPMAAGLNGRLVVAGGLEGSSPGRTWVLDFAQPTGPWVETTTMPLLRFDAGGAALAGSLFSIGGASNTAYWTEQETQQYTEGACATPTASPTIAASPSATPAAPSATPPLNSPTPPPPSATASPPPSASATPCALSFSDVHPSDYFYAPAQYLACHGVISGYADGAFRPYAGTTRAQMVKIVTLAFGVPPATPPAGGTFADVPPSHPFFAAVETAAARALVSGYACGAPGEPCDGANRPYFRPYAPVTRGQLAKIVVAAAGWGPRAPAAATFADVAPGSAFYGFVETAVCRGVLSGYACGGAGEPCDGGARPYFRPGTGATRGQIAKIVYNAVAAPAPCAP